MPAPISVAEWRRREKRIHFLIAPRGGTKQNAKTILRGGHQTVQEVERRIRIMDANGMNIGVTNALGCSRARFDSMVQKHMAPLKHKMSPERKALFDLMIQEGVSEKAALKVLGRSMLSRPINVKERLKLLKGKLDFKKYGISQIPVELFDALIVQTPFDTMRNSVKRLLKNIENKNAERVLDSVLPFWRRMAFVSNKIEVRTILAKWVFLVGKGIEPSGNLLRQYSLENLKKGPIRGKKLTVEEKKNLLQRYKDTLSQGLKLL